MFDVESTSLHGVGFCAAAVVYDHLGKKIDEFAMIAQEAIPLCNDFVKENILYLLKDIPSVATIVELRTHFYNFMQKHRHHAEFWSDVNFPVETNFLAAIVKDDPGPREWEMPYPLKDASNFLPIDLDRHATANKTYLDRLDKHNPIHDCIASYICLRNAYPLLHGY